MGRRKITNADWLLLKKAAVEAATNAYKDYSGYVVGAAGLVEDGTVFTGCNAENASYGVTLCAECGVVSDLVKAGYAKKLVAVYVVCVNADGTVVTITPCGRCRQLIYEHGGYKVRVMWLNGRPRTAKFFLPDAFGPANLGK